MRTLALTMVIPLAGLIKAQPLIRYQNEIFTGVKVSKNIVYGQNYALSLIHI